MAYKAQSQPIYPELESMRRLREGGPGSGRHKGGGGGDDEKSGEKSSAGPSAKVSRLTSSYIETALWSSTDEDGEPLDKSDAELAPETEQKMQADVDSFMAKAAPILGDNPPFDDAHVVHDFWLTRNGHGAGFWDGDYPKEMGDKLTELSKQYGEQDLYKGDDGKIYISGGKTPE